MSSEPKPVASHLYSPLLTPIDSTDKGGAGADEARELIRVVFKFLRGQVKDWMEGLLKKSAGDQKEKGFADAFKNFDSEWYR